MVTDENKHITALNLYARLGGNQKNSVALMLQLLKWKKTLQMFIRLAIKPAKRNRLPDRPKYYSD